LSPNHASVVPSNVRRLGESECLAGRRRGWSSQRTSNASGNSLDHTIVRGSPVSAHVRFAVRRVAISAVERNEVFCVTSFRIVRRRQKPDFWVGALGALSRLVDQQDWRAVRTMLLAPENRSQRLPAQEASGPPPQPSLGALLGAATEALLVGRRWFGRGGIGRVGAVRGCRRRSAPGPRADVDNRLGWPWGYLSGLSWCVNAVGLGARSPDG
jgi:hypothetical protein